MTWPTYPDAPGLPEYIARHNARQAGATRPGPLGAYGAAADVWRDGVLLWRSYDLALAESPDDWAERTWRPTLGDNWPRDHQSGPWSAPGVPPTLLGPVPTMDALRHVGTAQDVVDLLGALAAIASLPAPPSVGLDMPSERAIHTAISRDDDGWVTRVLTDGPVTVRALIGRCEPTPPDKTASKIIDWRVALERRRVRAGAIDAQLADGTRVFRAPADAPPHILARHAKAALGIPGHPAVRQRDSLVWVLACAPYLMTIDRVSSAT